MHSLLVMSYYIAILSNVNYVAITVATYNQSFFLFLHMILFNFFQEPVET